MATTVCAALLLAGCSSGLGPDPAERRPVVQPAVALDGSYVVTWDGTGTRNGAPADDLNKAKNGWVFRTACDQNGCVATGGSIVDPKNPTAPLKNVRVADYVDGRWVMVNVAEDAASCVGPDGAKHTSDGWSIWDIAVSGETLSATVTTVGTDDCPSVDVMTPTFTRVEDALPGFPIPDPADQPPRATPAAAAFRGDYTLTRTRRDQPDAKAVTNHRVETSCLRGEDRCVTTSIHNDDGDATVPFTEFTVYQFADGAFGRTSASADRTCDGGSAGIAAESETLPLPSAATSTPLRSLTGEVVATFTGGCAGRVVDDVQYALTSD